MGMSMGFTGLLCISYHKFPTPDATRDPTLETCRATLWDAVRALV